MSDSTTAQNTWIGFGEWLQEQMRRAVVSRTYLLGTTGLSRDEFIAVYQGKAAVDRELVIRLAEVMNADVGEACRVAGYELPEDYLDVPLMIRRFNQLPTEIQGQALAKIEELHRQHARRDANGKETETSEYVVIQGPWYDTTYWLTRFDEADDHSDAEDADTVA